MKSHNRALRSIARGKNCKK